METRLVQPFISDLEKLNPGSRVEWRDGQQDTEFDGRLMWKVSSAELSLDVEIKSRSVTSREDVRRIVGGRLGENAILLAAFISPAACDELRLAGWSYWDGTGNLLIRSSEPFVWVERSGMTRNPNPDKPEGRRLLRSLKGQAASVVVVRLLTEGRAASARELSRQTGVGVATVSRVLELLRGEQLLEETNGGPVVVRDASTLAARWTQDYSFTNTFKARRYFSLLGEEIARERLHMADFDYALTGVEAANDYLGSAGRIGALPPSETWIYVSDGAAAERTMQLMADPRGSIVIAECGFLSQEREGVRVAGNLRFARPWRTAGDLLSARGRTASVGLELAETLDRERV
ncbi:hypothetical protein [Agreia bicolorata]|nr:hypothetical protein [Agreia bicolorata]